MTYNQYTGLFYYDAIADTTPISNMGLYLKGDWSQPSTDLKKYLSKRPTVDVTRNTEQFDRMATTTDSTEEKIGDDDEEEAEEEVFSSFLPWLTKHEGTMAEALLRFHQSEPDSSYTFKELVEMSLRIRAVTGMHPFEPHTVYIHPKNQHLTLTHNTHKIGLGKTTVPLFTAAKLLPLTGEHITVVVHRQEMLSQSRDTARKYRAMLADEYDLDVDADINYGTKDVIANGTRRINMISFHRYHQLAGKYDLGHVIIDESHLLATTDTDSGATTNRSILLRDISRGAKSLTLMSATPSYCDYAKPHVDINRFQALLQGYHKHMLRMHVEECQHPNETTTATSTAIKLPKFVTGYISEHVKKHAKVKELRQFKAAIALVGKWTSERVSTLLIKLYDVDRCILLARALEKLFPELTGAIAIVTGGDSGSHLTTPAAIAAVDSADARVILTVFAGATGLSLSSIQGVCIVGDSDVSAFMEQLIGRADRYQGAEIFFFHLTCDIPRAGRLAGRVLSSFYGGAGSSLSTLPADAITSSTRTSRGEGNVVGSSSSTATTSSGDGGDAVVSCDFVVSLQSSLKNEFTKLSALRSKWKRRSRSSSSGGGDGGGGGGKAEKKEDDRMGYTTTTEAGVIAFMDANLDIVIKTDRNAPIWITRICSIPLLYVDGKPSHQGIMRRLATCRIPSCEAQARSLYPSPGKIQEARRGRLYHQQCRRHFEGKVFNRDQDQAYKTFLSIVWITPS